MSGRPLVELYGLAVDAPVALPGALVAGDRGADVVVRFAARPAEAARWPDEGTTEVFRSESEPGQAPNLLADRPGDGAYLRLRYAEGIRFHVSRDGHEVWADWEAPLTDADAVTFLLGPILGVVLRLQGRLALHASAVVLEGRAWAFLGPGGAGKSTLAAAFAFAGASVLSEDVLALRRDASGQWRVDPAYREIRLWDDPAALIAGAPAHLPALTPTWPKRGLDLLRHGLPFASSDAPLGGVFVLTEQVAEGQAPRCEALGAADALVELVANSYVNYLAEGPDLARELQALADVSRRTRHWLLHPGAGRDGLARTVVCVREAVASA